MTVSFQLIRTTKHPYWSFLCDCYATSFPIDERRPLTEMEAILSDPCFLYNAIEEDGDPVGLLNSWNLDNFRYVEHFTISPEFRSTGIGRQALHYFLAQASTPVILEVEPPIDETSNRRIRFYEKEGFTLCEKIYVQPPYSEEQQPVKLRLMEWGGRLLITDFEEVKNILYQRVYKDIN